MTSEIYRPPRAEIVFPVVWGHSGPVMPQQVRDWLLGLSGVADRQLAEVGLKTAGPAQIEGWTEGGIDAGLRVSWEVEKLPR